MGYLLVLLIAAATCSLGDSQNVTDELDTCAVESRGVWGQLLEEWATTPDHHGRKGRVMALPPSSGYYVTDRVGLAPPPPPPSRYYSEWSPSAPQPHPPTPAKIVNRPSNPYKDKYKPSYPPPQASYQQSIPVGVPPANSLDRLDEQNAAHKQVSETDLYLLSAIEKLVYRADLMEKRLRRMEESMHLLIAGKDKKPEPCVKNYSRVGGVCYHFSAGLGDWKAASLHCRKLRGNLLEIDGEQERQQLAAHMFTDKQLQGMDWWTGGLNPGLLWIWSSSARPVVANSTAAANATAATATTTVVGEGRCLAYIYDPAIRNHVYRGQDCALKHRFVCEKQEDDTQLSNEIHKAARMLRGEEGGNRERRERGGRAFDP